MTRLLCSILLALVLLPASASAAVVVTAPGVTCANDPRLTSPTVGQDYCFQSTVNLLYRWTGLWEPMFGSLSLNGLIGDLTLAGTTDQVGLVTAGNTITFGTPQDIAPGSSPAFLGLTLSGLGIAGNRGNPLVLGPSGALQASSYYTDVREWGAVCDGTDQAVAIEGAITAGKTRIFLPSGCLWVPTGDLIPGNVEILGEDWNTVTIQSSDPAVTSLSLANNGMFRNVRLRHKACTDAPGAPTFCPTRSTQNNSGATRPLGNWPNQPLAYYIGGTDQGSNDRPGLYGETFGEGDAIFLQNNAEGPALRVYSKGTASSAGVEIKRWTNIPGLHIDTDTAATSDYSLTVSTDHQTAGGFARFRQTTSTFNGDGLVMDFGITGGTFGGKFLNLQINGLVKASVDALGVGLLQGLTLGAAAELRFLETTGTDYVAFRGPAVVPIAYVNVLPGAPCANGEAWVSNGGTPIQTWVCTAVGGGGAGTLVSIGGQAGPVLTVNGTPDANLAIVAAGNDLSLAWLSTLSVARGGLPITPTNNVAPIGDGAAWVGRALPDCTDTGGQHLNFTAATSLFSCGTSGGSGGTITGTIANGQVAFGTGANAIGGTAAFVWNSAAGNLGVGTSNPVSKLHVEGRMTLAELAVGAGLHLMANAYYDGADKYLTTGNGGAGRLQWFNGAWILQTAPAGTADAAVTYTTRLTLDSTGLTLVTPLAVPSGGTGLAAGTSGGVPYFSSATTVASSAGLTNHGMMVGGGVGGAPSSVSALLNGQMYLGSTGGNPVASVINSLTIAQTPGAGSLGMEVTGITGGATGRIPFWTSSMQISNDALFLWDNTNKGLNLSNKLILNATPAFNTGVTVSGSRDAFFNETMVNGAFKYYVANALIRSVDNTTTAVPGAGGGDVRSGVLWVKQTAGSSFTGSLGTMVVDAEITTASAGPGATATENNTLTTVMNVVSPSNITPNKQVNVSHRVVTGRQVTGGLTSTIPGDIIGTAIDVYNLATTAANANGMTITNVLNQSDTAMTIGGAGDWKNWLTVLDTSNRPAYQQFLCDGTANDLLKITAAITAALARPQGAVVELPAGTCVIETGLTILVPNTPTPNATATLSFRGKGVGATTLKSTTASTVLITVKGQAPVQISDMTLGVPTSGTAVVLTSQDGTPTIANQDSRLVNLWIDGGAYGFHPTRAKPSVVDNVHFSNQTSAAIWVENLIDADQGGVRCNRCEILGAPTDAILATSGNLAFENSHILTTGTTGIHVKPTTSGQAISELWITGSKVAVANTVGGTALWFDFSASTGNVGGAFVSGSYFDAEQYGIRIDGAGGGTLSGSNFTGNSIRARRSASTTGACIWAATGTANLFANTVCDTAAYSGYNNVRITGATTTEVREVVRLNDATTSPFAGTAYTLVQTGDTAVPLSFAQLNAMGPRDGSFVFCASCTLTTNMGVCTSGASPVYATRISGAWRCQ